MVAPDVLLLTETNVPHAENIRYFGEGDEAHLVYQFSLPPLLLHALQSGNTTHLTAWAASLPDPPPGCAFLNFTASHDGIGIRPLEGLVPEPERDALIAGIQLRGGYVSTKTNSDGSESPYEMNTTYFDALKDLNSDDLDLQIARFLCSQTVTLALKGIPAIYFHSLTATPNDQAGVEKSGLLRAINRKKWNRDELEAQLLTPDSPTAKVFYPYVERLKIRAVHAAFHPDGKQVVIEAGQSIFAIQRVAPDGRESLWSIHNFTHRPLTVPKTRLSLRKKLAYRDLISGTLFKAGENVLDLEPYQSLWLVIHAG